MKNKLFGDNITVDCTYCENHKVEQTMEYCIKKKEIKNEKCRQFRYNPLLRVPNKKADKVVYTSDDFKI